MGDKKMMLRLKICSTVFVLYEILAVILMHSYPICTTLFGSAFCSDSVFKYFIVCAAIPALVGLIVMWVMYIIDAIRRRHSFMYRAAAAFEDVTASIKNTLKESVTGRDIEKYIVAALAAGVKKYSDKNPDIKKSLGNIIDRVTDRAGDYLDKFGRDDDDDDASGTSQHRARRKSATTRQTASRTRRK